MSKIKDLCQRILCAFLIILAAMFTILAMIIGTVGAVLFNKASDMFVYYSSIEEDTEWDQMIDDIIDIMDNIRKAFLYAKIEL